MPKQHPQTHLAPLTGNLAICYARLFFFLMVPALALDGPSHPDFFTFPELLQLSNLTPPDPALQKKLDGVLNIPVVGNYAIEAGVRPARPTIASLGPVLRALFWNIERGQQFDLVRLALSDPEGFAAEASKNPKSTPATLAAVREQVSQLMQADLLVLNEVDIGMKRSDYHEVGNELAAALKMNYVYGVEFVELDPVMLGVEKVQLKDADLAARLQKELEADPQRLRALHGSAILSRYPIQNARIVRLPVCHDWFIDESKPVPLIEKAKRLASDKIFLDEMVSERRRGGRIAIIASIEVPEAQGGIVTVAAPHLENKCPAACRVTQMNFLLDQLKSVTGPVIVTGDMNTTGSDGAILSLPYILQEKVKDYRTWGKQVFNVANPVNFFGVGSMAKNMRKYTDPTVHDVPMFGDNREYGLFKDLRKYRFADGGEFDFRGDPKQTVDGKGKTLSDSNQRDGKGFAYTFAMPRDFGGAIGRFKLDWFFIKAAGQQEGSAAKHPGAFSPWFPRTYQQVNDAPPDRISDHAPITVDLPLSQR
jgi:endonuclease/exonuclease/phosphatase family metal-dependent hydrolase